MAMNKVKTIDDRVRVTTVLASVYDKTGLDTLVRGLRAVNSGLHILSTGGTYAAVAAALGRGAEGSLQQVSDYTGQPEMQGGLVKTLDFRIYLGLLSETYNAAHRADLERTGAQPIDMVIVNLYPFRQVTARAGASLEDARGNIDVGGPCMVRAAAKNFHRVAALTDPGDYDAILRELTGSGGALCLATRFRLAQKAFRLTAEYDEAIAAYLAGATLSKERAAYAVRNGV
jgi:phosphoribosylaminoimidazolecarboxamide formyltransferase/IMP cyclohydrolase